MRGPTSVAGLALALAAPLVANAQPTTADQALAETLFAEGRRLMAESKYAEACPKLAESQRLDPGGGTLLNLALCHESEGKLATAWAELKDALALARKDARSDREEIALARLAAVEPRLSRLVVTVDPAAAAVPGLVVSLGAAPLAPVAWGVATPVDPGVVVVAAAAPGKLRWETGVRIEADAQLRSITIPPLVDAPRPSAPPPSATMSTPVPPAPADDGESGRRTRRTIGWVVGGAGVAAGVVGTIYGLSAFSKRSDSDPLCPTDETCTSEGEALNDEAKSAALVSNVAFGFAIAGVGAGVVLILTSSSDDRKRAAALRLGARNGGAAIDLDGSF